MRFVMFTPGLQASAIGRVAAMVTRALRAQDHSVAVVRSEEPELLAHPVHDFGTEVVPWTESERVTELIRTSDMVIYQLGDNYPYHRGCVEWLEHHRGLVCLHDFFLGGLFHGWSAQRRAQARSVLQGLYGDTVAANYFSYSSTEAFIEGTREAAPLTEWISSMACGVVTHSHWGVQRVLRTCPGPVRVVPLPYEAPPAALAAPPAASRELKLLTVGHVNPNKRATSVIRAIGASRRLRAATTYRLLGAIAPEMESELAAVARSAGVRLVISGQAPADQLAAALAEADVICCLRWPTLEAASASTIEAMLCGKPVIVVDAGFYAELPDDCVVKIRPEQEVRDLQLALEQFAADPAKRRAMGERAARWATATFSASNYAVQLVEATIACRRVVPALDVVEAAAQQLKVWGDVPHLVECEQTIAPLALFDATATKAPSVA